MKKLFLSVVLVSVLGVMVFGLALAADVQVTDPAALKDLATVRQATAKYQNVDAAIAAGYVPTPACVAVPGVGGMGYHYINFGLAMDPAISLTAPEVLLYAPSGDGLRLVGVEYFLALGAPGDPIPPNPPAAPVLFGRTFDGPMLGHEPDMPPHYDLHVWIWQPNPMGMFTPLNPSVNCP